MRLLTDLQIVGLVIVVAWAVWYFGPLFLQALRDPYADDHKDVDMLAERDRQASWCAVHRQPFTVCWQTLGTVTVERTCHG